MIVSSVGRSASPRCRVADILAWSAPTFRGMLAQFTASPDLQIPVAGMEGGAEGYVDAVSVVDASQSHRSAARRFDLPIFPS